jgi:SAM-dependent methyltransferase
MCHIPELSVVGMDFPPGADLACPGMGPVDAWDAMVAAWRMPGDETAAGPKTGPPLGPAEAEAHGRTPSQRWAREALPLGGTVLDVGCGVGAASWPLADRAGRIVGVDADPSRTAAFEVRAKTLDVEHETVVGAWPEVAPRTPTADVVVCHHVLYHAPGFETFVAALTRHARERVVVELPLAHPHAWLRPVWGALGGGDPGPAPGLADALAAFAALGMNVHVASWDDPWAERGMDLVREVRSRLSRASASASGGEFGAGGGGVSVGVAGGVAPPSPQRMATLWWTGRSARGGA